jgi:hypothetical protein
MILPCTCKHDFQDRAYGYGKRVFNPTNFGYRCTVCSREIRAPNPREVQPVKEGKENKHVST